MRKRFISAIALAFAGCTPTQTSAPAQLLAAASNGLCQPAPVRTEALDNPSKHAWDLFLALNHPAKDETVARGEPDCAKGIGTPGTTTVWETWRNAATEVFLVGGKEPPVWQDNSLPDEKPGTVPPKPVDSAGAVIAALHNQRSSSSGGLTPMFSPDDGVFNNKGGFGETRMNRATYDFVRDECLFSKQGLNRYAAAIEKGKKKSVSFPVDSIEAKAAWLDLVKENIPQDKWGTYYTAEYKGKKYGLVALHVLTKDVPNWFWATFHHKDSPANQFETEDTYGRPQILTGTVWQNYELGGTQTDFTTSTGAPTLLSDHYVEFGFQRSSCITCHATATLSTNGSLQAAQPRALCSLNPNTLPAGGCKKLLGPDAFKPGTNDLVIERGVPDPTWFKENGKPHYLQTDFVWAIPFRTDFEPEGAQPPARCIW